ncbi:MAG: hypothetical protein F6K62_09875 [Sphaerospermopsis sp. SIO1G2]|nr:hypothetical protein [Sphaerospermopsis sp. SIO1G2]
MKQGVRRTYEQVTITADDATNHPTLLLDGIALRTQAGHALTHPSAPLMHEIAQEWDAQTTHIHIEQMPLTRLLFALIDRQPEQRARWQNTIIEHATHDSLCYRDAQHHGHYELWDRWLAWAENRFDAQWQITHSIMPALQAQATLQRIQDWLEGRSNGEILALYRMTESLGSFILAAAIYDDALTPEDAIEAAWLEQRIQMQRWGHNESIEAKQHACLEDVTNARMFLRFLQDTQDANLST